MFFYQFFSYSFNFLFSTDNISRPAPESPNFPLTHIISEFFAPDLGIAFPLHIPINVIDIVILSDLTVSPPAI